MFHGSLVNGVPTILVEKLLWIAMEIKLLKSDNTVPFPVGGVFRFNLEQTYCENKTDGFLYSLNSFFDKNGSISLEIPLIRKK